MSSGLSSGYSLSISFVVMPLAMSSMIRYSGMRVPFMTGFPASMFGSMIILSNKSSMVNHFWVMFMIIMINVVF